MTRNRCLIFTVVIAATAFGCFAPSPDSSPDGSDAMTAKMVKNERKYPAEQYRGKARREDK